jgi:hypothetical protein
MIKLSFLPYYFKMVSSLLFFTSWWRIPILLIKTPVIYKIPLHLQFYVSNFMDVWTLQEVLVDQHYERFRNIKQHGVVLDIGGGIGDFSVFASKIRHASQVHSYELHPERLALFKKNVALNHAKHITLHEKPALSLTKVFKECKMSHCDFMKIDCEGAEYQIFMKAPVTVLKKIHTISFEMHFFNDSMKRKYIKLKSLLISAGFELIEQKNPVRHDICFLYAIRN